MSAPALTPATAFAIASAWGSYLNASDPGACLYSFRADDGRPVSEEHRAQCLAYIDEHCLPVARNETRSRDDVEELEALRLYLAGAPLATGAAS